VNLADFLNGASYVIKPPPDALQEFSVRTSNYSAELGHAAGGVLNACIKSGTNVIHGSLWEFFRNDHLNAIDWFSAGKAGIQGESVFRQIGPLLFGSAELFLHRILYQRKERTTFVPPPKKAAKKAAGHHHDRHRQANDLRRAYEHMGRLEVLQKSLKSSSADAVDALTKLAQKEIEGGHNKDAADLLRASEHLSFAVPADDSPRGGLRSTELVQSISEHFDELTRRADEHWEDQERHSSILARLYQSSRKNAVKALECARAAEALAHVKQSWGEAEAVRATAHLDGHDIPMERVKESQVWEASVSTPHKGVHSLVVSVEDTHGNVATDEIRVAFGDPAERERVERDRDNVLEAWPEHGLPGTQLGPNKNGKKW
jgi:hypothetical protein